MKNPTLELIWRDSANRILRKQIPWLRGCSNETLAEYMTDYFVLISEGYRPKDYDYVPIPHCARVYDRGRVLAEWYLRPEFSAESPVTADERPGRGGIPAAVPIAPCSEYLGVPTQLVPRRKDSDENRRDLPNDARLGQAALTKG